MTQFKLWIDDMREPPENEPRYTFDNSGWLWCRSTKEAITAIRMYDRSFNAETILIDLDHDSGTYYNEGGDYINILNWLEASGMVDTGYFFHIHSMNPVGVQNMRAIIEHNGWREVK